MIKGKKMKKDSGFTMIVSVLIVVVIILIAAIILGNNETQVQVEGLKNMQTDIKALDEKINSYYSEKAVLPTLREYEGSTSFLWSEDGKNYLGNPNDSQKYYIIDIEKLSNLSLNYGNEFYEAQQYQNEELKDLYIIDEQSHQIYYPKGVAIQDGDQITMYYGYDGMSDENVGDEANNDKTPPEITFLPDGKSVYAQEVVVKISATDKDSNVKNIIYYLWTKDNDKKYDISNFEIDTSIENNKEVKLNQTSRYYQGDGTYYLWAMAEDIYGNKVVKRSNSYQIDTTQVTSDSNCYEVSVSAEGGIYSAGVTIEVVASFNEKIKGSGSSLKYRFGEGEEKCVLSQNEFSSASEKQAKYQFHIENGDNGALQILGLTQGFTDEAGNGIQLDTFGEKTYDNIVADTVKPELTMGEAESTNTIANGQYANYINKSHTITLKINMYDIHYKALVEFLISSVETMVAEKKIENVTTELKEIQKDGTERAVLQLKSSNVTGNGEVSIKLPKGLVEDKAANVSNKSDEIKMIPMISGQKVIVDNIVPKIDKVKIYSTNENQNYVRNGQKVKLDIQFSEPIAELPAVTIGGRRATFEDGTLGKTQYTAYIDILESEKLLQEGNLAITIGNFKDRAANEGTGINHTTDQSYVIYDRTKPTITLKNIENRLLVLPDDNLSNVINQDGLMAADLVVNDLNLKDDATLKISDITIMVNGQPINQETYRYFAGPKQEVNVKNGEKITFLSYDITGNGIISLKIKNAILIDKAGNTNDEIILERDSDDDKTLTADNISPTVEIKADVTLNEGFTKAEVITYQLKFSENVGYRNGYIVEELEKERIGITNGSVQNFKKIDETTYEITVSNQELCNETMEKLEQKIKINHNITDYAGNPCEEKELIVNIDRKSPQIMAVSDPDKKVLQVGTEKNEVYVTITLDEEVQLDFEKLKIMPGIISGESETKQYKKEWKLGVKVDTSKETEEGKTYQLTIPKDIFKDRAGNGNQEKRDVELNIIIGRYVISTANELEEFMEIVNLGTQGKDYRNVIHTGSENYIFEWYARGPR